MTYVKSISDENIYKPNDFDNENNDINNDINDNVNNDVNDDVNNDVNNDLNDNLDLEANITDILLKISKIIKLIENKNQVTGSWIVIFLILLILNTLIFGLINLKHETETAYLYGINGAYTFNVYYIMNIVLYSLFFIIHLFLISTYLSYAIDEVHFIKYLIINYRQIRYNIIVTKIMFLIALLILLFVNGDDDGNGNGNDNDADNTLPIPLYYNLILIETIFSMLLILVIHNVIIINKILNF
jgi:hypothetical protein